jgi:putative oxidoreductase
MLDRLERWYDVAMTRGFDHLGSPLLLLLRLVFGWQLFETGKGKLENIDRFIAFLTHLNIPMPAANARFVASLECIGGLLLLLGLAARLIAIPLTINFIVAFLTADREAVVNFFKDQDAFTNAAPFLYLLVSLIVLAFGPGLFSLDALIARMRGRRLPAPATPIAT